MAAEFRAPINASQVGELLNVSIPTVYNLARRGALPHVRVSTGRIVFERDQIDRFLALRRVTAEQAVRAASA